MRVVLDTNVLISMILGGVVGELVDEWDARQFQVVTSTEIVAEYATLVKLGVSREIPIMLRALFWIFSSN